MTKTQRKKLNKLLHLAVRARDGAKCLRCEKTTVLQLSHIYPKGKNRGMEFELSNVKLLCYGCHIHFWHKTPLEATVWLNKTLPAARLRRLKDMSNQHIKVSTIDYDKLTKKLENYVEKTNRTRKANV